MYSFHPFHSALLRYRCGVLPLVTSNFNSIVLETEYESCLKRAHSYYFRKYLSSMGNDAKVHGIS